jgi:hypothetical protein
MSSKEFKRRVEIERKADPQVITSTEYHTRWLENAKRIDPNFVELPKKKRGRKKNV